MKDVLVPIDKAGRVVLPKGVREELAIKPGDVLRVTIQGTSVTLTPSHEDTGFVRQGKALVFTTGGEARLTTEMIERLREEELEEHSRLGAGRLAAFKRKT